MAVVLARVRSEIEADRKTAGAWLLEKVARFKPNGHLRGYSPLSRVLELEGLAMGMAVRAKEQRSAIKGLHQIAVAAIDLNRGGWNR